MLNMSFDNLSLPNKATILKYMIEYINTLWSQIFLDLNNKIYENAELETSKQMNTQ